MIFWTTWMAGFIAAVICIGAAIDRPQQQWFWLCCSYFAAFSGVALSLVGVPL